MDELKTVRYYDAFHVEIDRVSPPTKVLFSSCYLQFFPTIQKLLNLIFFVELSFSKPLIIIAKNDIFALFYSFTLKPLQDSSKVALLDFSLGSAINILLLLSKNCFFHLKNVFFIQIYTMRLINKARCVSLTERNFLKETFLCGNEDHSYFASVLSKSNQSK